uniref:F-ATPase protein 6 n=1 Tax=Strongyloides ratti TaxID=34506 RepID=A0A7I5TZC1_STRRB
FFSFFDFFVFLFLLHFIFCQNNSMLNIFSLKFFDFLSGVFTYSVKMPMSYLFSCFIFVFLLVCCFFGYFSYSYCVLGVIEFTFFFSIVSWFATFLTMISSQKFSVYMKKSGDGFFKTFFLLLVELVSEFSRPVALSVRLYANIMVGHIITMSLYLVLESSYYFSFFMVFAIVLECFVFVLQSYIFSRLVYLYINE